MSLALANGFSHSRLHPCCPASFTTTGCRGSSAHALSLDGTTVEVIILLPMQMLWR